MNRVINIVALFGLILAANAQAVQLTGQDAKDLYLALKGVKEARTLYYSYRKKAEPVSCSHFYRGPRYNEHFSCLITDGATGAKIPLHDIRYFDGHPENVVEGAESLYKALKGIAFHADHSNPPVQGKDANVTCDLTSPTANPEDEVPESFSCELTEL